MLDLGATSPPTLLARQLAERAGCGEVVHVAAAGDAGPDAVVRAADDVGPLLRHVSPWAAAAGPWVAKRLREGVVVVDVDDLVDLVSPEAGRSVPEVLGPLVTTATFSVLASRDREPDALARMAAGSGAVVAFAGRWSHGESAGAAVVVAEAPTHPHSVHEPPPDDFTVTAFVTVFNEEDVLASVLDDLHDQGVRSYVLDNWSTDDSWDVTGERLGGAVIGAERWPADGPAQHFDLKASLARITDLARELESDWFLKHDADEIRRAPWPDVTLAQGLWTAQVAGYNVVDFTVMNYQPVDNDFARGHDLWTYFDHFEFGRKPGHFRQFKAWRNFGQEVDYARFGSHRVAFPGVRVHPYKFELHHYPIRSQDHGLRKVLAERQERYLPAARARGWHTHYDGITAASNFLADPEGLWSRRHGDWDALVVERLSGAGLPREG